MKVDINELHFRWRQWLTYIKTEEREEETQQLEALGETEKSNEIIKYCERNLQERLTKVFRKITETPRDLKVILTVPIFKKL